MKIKNFQGVIRKNKKFPGPNNMGKLGGTTAEVSRDIDLKKLNFQGLFDFILDFSRGYEHFLNQNIKAEKVGSPPCMVIKRNNPIS